MDLEAWKLSFSVHLLAWIQNSDLFQESQCWFIFGCDFYITFTQDCWRLALNGRLVLWAVLLLLLFWFHSRFCVPVGLSVFGRSMYVVQMRLVISWWRILRGLGSDWDSVCYLLLSRICEDCIGHSLTVSWSVFWFLWPSKIIRVCGFLMI